MLKGKSVKTKELGIVQNIIDEIQILKGGPLKARELDIVYPL